jgi:2-C-methyl-D-erythritol 4-phosphate cytidylyltransferase
MNHVVIVAGGLGTRMKSNTPKQFMQLAGKPVVFYSMERFHAFDPNINIVLVLPEKHVSEWKGLCELHNFTIPHTIALGGPTRFHSVKSGLNAIDSNDGIVGVHDGARPLINPILIQEAYTIAEKHGNAIPAVAPAETVREINGPVSKQLNREHLRLIQTPQCFKLSTLKRAYEAPYNEVFTDDASVAEDMGERIHLIEGDRANLKITTPADLTIAEALLNG